MRTARRGTEYWDTLTRIPLMLFPRWNQTWCLRNSPEALHLCVDKSGPDAQRAIGWNVYAPYIELAREYAKVQE
jgi:hypothetical protein